ncbi:unnamed protein product [Clonostachys rosea f. rosea IK726]|uniref:REJ domain-containing protein n=2 Tax=Bionectria ochroleuca TaxID=29856 RepID=A0A8H7K131_BIOOC|nr:unnamed protein product [Clonostachys rosea f. rosea IK726]
MKVGLVFLTASGLAQAQYFITAPLSTSIISPTVRASTAASASWSGNSTSAHVTTPIGTASASLNGTTSTSRATSTKKTSTSSTSDSESSKTSTAAQSSSTNSDDKGGSSKPMVGAGIMAVAFALAL